LFNLGPEQLIAIGNGNNDRLMLASLMRLDAGPEVTTDERPL